MCMISEMFQQEVEVMNTFLEMYPYSVVLVVLEACGIIFAPLQMVTSLANSSGMTYLTIPDIHQRLLSSFSANTPSARETSTSVDSPPSI